MPTCGVACKVEVVGKPESQPQGAAQYTLSTTAQVERTEASRIYEPPGAARTATAFVSRGIWFSHVADEALGQPRLNLVTCRGPNQTTGVVVGYAGSKGSAQWRIHQCAVGECHPDHRH